MNLLGAPGLADCMKFGMEGWSSWTSELCLVAWSLNPEDGMTGAPNQWGAPCWHH